MEGALRSRRVCVALKRCVRGNLSNFSAADVEGRQDGQDVFLDFLLAPIFFILTSELRFYIKNILFTCFET
ncbi:hypothetical protein PUN28_019235 [Cardiocondyla obscurior]|uniref:Uncharacterized protein n=1 Tax=Cardiocondyla obscurior TaxID=286306 RepID=A0AAW2EAJ3_9HYME